MRCWGGLESGKGLIYKKYEINSLLLKKKDEMENEKNKLIASLTSKANSEIKRNPFFVKQGDTYNINNIKSEIFEITSNKSLFPRLEENEIDFLKKQIEEKVKPAISIINISRPKFGDVIRDCILIIEKKITPPQKEQIPFFSR